MRHMNSLTRINQKFYNAKPDKSNNRDMCNSNASASTSAKLNQACQLTKLKQTKEQERYPNRFWHLCEKLLPGWQAKQSQRSWSSLKTSGNWRTSQCTLTVQSPKTSQGGGFTVKQSATTIHKDSVARTVSTSSLTMEMEAVTHALHWTDSKWWQATHAITLTGSKEKDHTDRLVGNATNMSGFPQKIRSVEELETPPEGTKPSRQWPPHGGRCRKRNCLPILLEWTEERA